MFQWSTRGRPGGRSRALSHDAGQAGAQREDRRLRAQELDRMKRHLQRRRQQILETSRRADDELDGLRSAERDPEFEEGAQNEHAQYTLAALTDVHRREIAAIDAAFDRIETGEYGACLDCEREIDPKRLHALPYALRCADCATRHERGMVTETAGPSL